MRLTFTLLLVACLVAWGPAQASPGGAANKPPAKRAAKTKAARARHTAAHQAQANQAQPAGEGQPAGQEKPAGQGDQAGPQQETPPPEKQAPPKTATVSVGGAQWGLSGNETKFRQYATPPKGFYIPELLYGPSGPTHGWQGSLVLRSLFQQDRYYEGLLDFLWGTSRIEAWQQRNQYFDPTPLVETPSSQQWSNVSFRQLLGQRWGLALNYRMDEQSWLLEPPREPLYQRTRSSSALLNGRLGPGELGLTVSDWHYFDRTQILPDTGVTRFQARYALQAARTVGLEGLYQYAQIRQPGLPDSHIETLGFGGDVALGPDTDVALRLQRDNVDLPTVQSASVRQQRFADLRLFHRFGRWSAQVGANEREVERVRGDQTYVDVPRWATFDARVAGRLTRDLRLTLRGSYQQMTNRPPTITLDPRPLYWSNRTFGQAKLEGAWNTLSGYLVGTYRRYDNTDRSVGVTNRNVTLGGNWDVNPRVSLFGEFAYDSWSGQSEVTAFPTLANFMPDARTSLIGVNWAITPRASLWAGYTEWATWNDNPLLLANGNTNGRFLSLNARYLFPSGSQLGLVVAPWVYRDKVVSQMDYDTAVVMVTGSSRF